MDLFRAILNEDTNNRKFSSEINRGSKKGNYILNLLL